MNREALNARIQDLANQKKQVLAKQEEGKNVIISGQQIVEQTNQMLHMISGAEQDCQFWMTQIEEDEKAQAALSEEHVKGTTELEDAEDLT